MAQEIRLSDRIQFHVNNVLFTLKYPDIHSTLSSWLNLQPGLSGTKTMCNQGGCGSCVVNVEKNGESFAMNSCLLPLCSLNNCRITTVEGIGSSRKGFHPIQNRISKFNGSQCGFCTPGFVMSMYSLLDNENSPVQNEIEATFDGNICRCTGYRPILDAMKSFASDADERLVIGIRCQDIEDTKPCQRICKKRCTQPCVKPESFFLQNENNRWFKTNSVADLLLLCKEIDFKNKSTKIICGNTGISVTGEDILNLPETYVDISSVKEFQSVENLTEELEIGACVTLSKLINTFSELQDQSDSFVEITKHIKKIANVPVRNAASWAGNLMLKHNNGQFPSDIFTLMTTAGAKLKILDLTSNKTDMIEMNTFLNFNMDTKVISSAVFPKIKNKGSEVTVIKTYKVAPRSKNALGYINAGFKSTIKDDVFVNESVVSFGGINSSFTRAYEVEKYLAGKSVNQSTLTGALKLLSSKLKPEQFTAASASIEYKTNVALGLFYKFFVSLLKSSNLSPGIESAILSFPKTSTKAKQTFSEDEKTYPVSKAISKITGNLQASGETYYARDRVPTKDELFAVIVKSEIANADIDSIIVTEALSSPGCKNIIYGSNFPSEIKNMFHPNYPSYTIFPTDHVEYAGQPIGIVIADSPLHAQMAAKKVNVTFKNQKPPILTIEEAVKQGSLIPAPDDIIIGEPDKAMASADIQFEGEMSLGSQYHMYMELQHVRCSLTDDGGFQLEIGTQMQKLVQLAVATAMGISCNKVDIVTKRIGGAFGGKATNTLLPACATALCSYVSQRPVRLITTLQDCMETYGLRSRYKMKYRIGVNKSGKLQSIICTVFTDSGCADYDQELNDDFMLKEFADSGYFCENRRMKTVVCKTNVASTTWLRCPGQLQCTGFAESIMEHAANVLKMDVLELKRVNLYQSGQRRLTGDLLEDCSIEKLFQNIISSSKVEERRNKISEFNKNNKWRKKGLTVTPLRYSVELSWASFTAQVAIFADDGSVIVSHGGIDCGQGINTKIIQVVALGLGISMDKVSVKTTQTVTSPNSTDTGAAVTSEVCCMAVLECCKILLKRIEPVKKKLKPDASWETVIAACSEECIDLLATYFVTPKYHEKSSYQTYAVGSTEVELDVITGEYQISRVDILYDCGKSINPAIDIGQIEGAFMMGVGFWLSEKIVHDSKTGKLLTNSTWTYHVPTADDVPKEWNIELLENTQNPYGFMRSKTAGEPPMCVSISSFFALKQAIQASRIERNQNDYFQLDAPATIEELQLKLNLNPINDFHL